MTTRKEFNDIVHGLRDYLELHRTGTAGHWMKHERRKKEQKVVPSGSPERSVPVRKAEKTPMTLEAIREELGECRRCALGKSRIKLVYGVGNPKACVMLIGEGPGYQEDRQGEPFVGPAGKLLDKILESIGLSRQKVDPDWKWVYITNIVKCHPMTDPTNPDARGNDRPPLPEESDTCLPFLLRQIKAIGPTFIVTLGASAAKTLLPTTQGIMGIRGKWVDWTREDVGPIRLIPTYHPAALLRNPNWKKDVWEDMKKLRDELHKLHPSS
ncbi:MAG TPA: uracil-DNA glycosylase [Elusimicrobiota bacterium]|nr:uracil-DNA glycosylase [Elusimicrobiota bacterium]